MFKCIFFLILLLFLSLTGAISCAKQEGEMRETLPKLQVRRGFDTEPFLPTGGEECIEKLVIDEPVLINDEINPFYLRANLDGNTTMDTIILLKGKLTKKNGVLVCRDGLEPTLFGPLTNQKPDFTDFSSDDFITPNWGIESADYPIADDSKWEKVVFAFDGGGVYIYWNGSRFILLG